MSADKYVFHSRNLPSVEGAATKYKLAYRKTLDGEVSRLLASGNSELISIAQDVKHKFGFPNMPRFALSDLVGKRGAKVTYLKTARYEEWSVVDDFSSISSQGDTEGCEGNAWMDALEILKGPADFQQLSRAFAYWTARRLTRSENDDGGTFAGAIVYAAKKSGVSREALWPYSKATINDRPDDLAYADAFAHKLDEVYAIRDLGKSRVEMIIDTVKLGFVQPIGVQVGDEWFNVDNAETAYFAPKSPVGGHEMIIVGVRIWSDGRIWFKVRNSWGTDWGRSGYAYVDASYIADPIACDEVSVPTVALEDFDTMI